MADARFFTNRGPLSIAEIIAITGAKLEQPEHASRVLNDVAALDRAGENDLSFFDNSKYLEQFTHSAAGACLVKPKYAPQAPAGMAVLVTEDPYRAYALITQKFYAEAKPAATIHPTAVVDASAKLGKNVHIAAGAVIGARAELADDVEIGPNAVIGDGVVIGAQTRIGALTSITHSLIGERVIIHRGVHIGQDGFGFALGRAGHVKVPQLGRVIIGNDVEIGSGTTIDRGAGPDTMIGDGTKIDNLVQIGHNVVIGKLAVIVAQVGISGSTRVGDGAVLAGQSGVAGHLKIGAGAKIAAKSGVISDIPPGSSYGGAPAMPALEWHRQTIALKRLTKRGT